MTRADTQARMRRPRLSLPAPSPQACAGCTAVPCQHPRQLAPGMSTLLAQCSSGRKPLSIACLPVYCWATYIQADNGLHAGLCCFQATWSHPQHRGCCKHQAYVVRDVYITGPFALMALASTLVGLRTAIWQVPLPVSEPPPTVSTLYKSSGHCVVCWA